MFKRIARIAVIAGGLHGNADSAFSPWQVRHCEALRGAGFNVLDIDYRGFGPTPGEPSEAAMYEDSEAAYQDLLRRGIPENRIVLLGQTTHSRNDKLIPYSHALTLFATANEPKQLITFDAASNDGFGGHVDALYEHVDILKAALAKRLPTLQQQPPNP